MSKKNAVQRELRKLATRDAMAKRQSRKGTKPYPTEDLYEPAESDSAAWEYDNDFGEYSYA